MDFRHLAPLLAVALLAGCSQGGVVRPATGLATGPAMVPAALPSLVPGEHFTYDDGIRRQVVAIRGGNVEWQDSRGTVVTTTSNPLAPELAWESGSRGSRSTISGNPDALWPLATGSRSDFTVESRRFRDGVGDPATGRDWQCIVTGSERLVVPAGPYDTWVTRCTRSDAASGRSRGTRTFWYAPQIGVVVQRVDRSRSGTERVRRLVEHGYDSRLLPTSEQRTLKGLLAEILDEHADGEAATWSSRTLPVSLMLVPVSSYERADGRSCRAYRSIYSVYGRVHVNERDYCRTDDGRAWKRET